MHEKQDNDLAKTPAAYVRPLDIKEQQENKAAMLARNQDLMFVSPMLSGFSLNDKIWRKTEPAALPHEVLIAS